MIHLILLLLLFCSGSIFAAAFFKLRFEVIIPFTMIGVIIFLFFTALAGILQAAYFVLISLMILCYPLAIFRAVKSRDVRGFLSRFFTPGFLVFVLVFGVLWIGNRGRLLMNVDEYRMWGAVVRLMYRANGLATAPSSPLWETVKSYPPGMGMLQYFWMKVVGIYTDANLFRCYQLYCLTLLMPAMRGIDWKNWKKIIAIMLLLFIIPLVFGSSVDSKFYKNIFIDPALGMTFGFALSMIFFSSQRRLLDFIAFGALLAVLVMLKDAGLALAVIALLIYIVDLLFHQGWQVRIRNSFHSRSGLPDGIRCLISILALAAIPVLVNAFWHANLNANSIKDKFNATTLTGIIQSVQNHTNPLRHVVSIFVAALSTKAITGSLIQLSWFAILAVFALVLFFLCRCFERPLMLRFKTVSAGLLIGFVAFTIGLLWMYMYQYSLSEAETLSSYARYLEIYLSGMTVFLFFLISDSLMRNVAMVDAAKLRTVAAVLCSLILVITPITADGGLVTMAGGDVAASKTVLQAPMSAANDIESKLNDHTAKVFVLMQGGQAESAEDYFCLRYLLLSSNVRLNDAWWSWWINDTPSAQPAAFDDNLARRIGSGYDYVYLMNINPDFAIKAGSLFDGGVNSVKAFCLYRVEHNGAIRFVKVQNR